MPDFLSMTVRALAVRERGVMRARLQIPELSGRMTEYGLKASSKSSMVRQLTDIWQQLHGGVPGHAAGAALPARDSAPRSALGAEVAKPVPASAPAPVPAAEAARGHAAAAPVDDDLEGPKKRPKKSVKKKEKRPRLQDRYSADGDDFGEDACVAAAAGGGGAKVFKTAELEERIMSLIKGEQSLYDQVLLFQVCGHRTAPFLPRASLTVASCQPLEVSDLHGVLEAADIEISRPALVRILDANGICVANTKTNNAGRHSKRRW
jgi:hypothetical protein